jgi:Ca2+-transporting ATPase
MVETRRGPPVAEPRRDSPVAEPWAQPAEDVLRAAGVERERGLARAEVTARRRRFGPNRLRQTEQRGAWRILLDQVKSLMVALLAVAAAISFAFGQTKEGLAVLVVVAINAAIGFATEWRAARSMDALQRLGQTTARVRRGGQVEDIPATETVPGDVALIEGGDVITADLRLVAASKLQVDESALTGESAPVDKSVEPLAPDTALPERANMLFKGTAVTRGSAEGVVVGTGMATELGRISSLVAEAKEERTPLEKRLDRLGHRLIWLTLVVGAAVAGAGIAAGKRALLMVETAIALAVATIPEGLPVVATVALARGMWRMARRNALVRRLSSVETLGATSVIFTDKTGTLTENRMAVVRIALPTGQIEVDGDAGGEGPFRSDGRSVSTSDQPALASLLETGVLCNNASLSAGSDRDGVGDPLEVALLAAGALAGIDRGGLAERLPEVREEAFDPDVKMMATIHRDEKGFRIAVKGAAEAVVASCARVQAPDGDQPLADDDGRQWLERSDVLAREGLRVLALATRRSESAEAEAYADLTLLGLVGLLDPPRRDVAPAIAACREAGIRVVMVTGDQPATALAVARAVDLVDDEAAQATHGREVPEPDGLSEEGRRRLLETAVFARVTPEQKLRLIALYQEAGAVVGMTGDGVNDAPALKKADIGIAMGERGTQVAREAADMVLKDDAFGTIVAAVAEGRTIFRNIRAFVLYLLSCNLSEILVVGLASLSSAPLPILPLQILFLNLVTDVFPALALGVGEGDPAAMRQPPRDPREPMLTRRHWLAIVGDGAVLTVAVLGAFGLALAWLDLGPARAVTVSFLTLAFAQLVHVLNMRDPGSGLVLNEVTRNPFIWGALLLCTGLLFAVVYLPGPAGVLGLEPPGAAGWVLVLAFSPLPVLVGPLLRAALFPPPSSRDRLG